MRKKIDWKKTVTYIFNPPSWVTLLAYMLTFTAGALSVFIAAAGYGLTLSAFVVYSVCGVALTYAVFLSVRIGLKVKDKVLLVADRYTFTRNFKKFEFRTLFFALCSFAGNVAYTVFLCVAALYSRTFWYWVLAGFYVILASMRGGLLYENQKVEKRFVDNPLALAKAKSVSYKNCGFMLLALSLVLSGAVTLMVLEDKRFPTPNVVVLALAAWDAVRVAFAVYNLLRAKKCDDLVIRSVRNINFSTALVATLTLQTVLLDTVVHSLNTDLLNGLTGGAVCATVVAFGVYMIVVGERVRKRIERKEREIYRERSSFDGYNREDYGVEYRDGKE